jgi:enterochelin esterase-like enzyme
MRTFTYSISFLLLLTASNLQAQGFLAFLSKLHAAPAARQQFMADSFLATIPRTPLIENDSVCHFLYKTTAGAVRIAGDHNNWSDTRSPMTMIPNTDLWYRTDVFAPTARLDYKIVADDAWLLDPRNPLTVSGGFGPNSELRMSQYQEPLEILSKPGVPHGRMVDTTFTSVDLNNQRQVRIYLPPGYDNGSESYPLVLFHDGLDYIRLAAVPTTLDNLIAQRRIPPVIALFVPPVDRTEEYAGSRIDTFTRFIVQQLLPAIDARYRSRTDPQSRAMIGSSNGGNISLYIAMKHPDVFGNAGAQSSNIIPAISSRIDQSPALALRLYLDLGVYDIPVLIPLVKSFVSQLMKARYDYLYQEFYEGHSWGNWRAHIDDALSFFFAPLLDAPATPATLPGSIDVGDVWPNPSSAQFSVTIDVRKPAFVSAVLYDTLGREAMRLYGAMTHKQSLTITASTAALPRGVYHLRVSSGSTSRIRTVVLR